MHDVSCQDVKSNQIYSHAITFNFKLPRSEIIFYCFELDRFLIIVVQTEPEKPDLRWRYIHTYIHTYMCVHVSVYVFKKDEVNLNVYENKI